MEAANAFMLYLKKKKEESEKKKSKIVRNPIIKAKLSCSINSSSSSESLSSSELYDPLLKDK